MAMHIDQKENMKNKIEKMKDDICKMNKEIQKEKERKKRTGN